MSDTYKITTLINKETLKEKQSNQALISTTTRRQTLVINYACMLPKRLVIDHPIYYDAPTKDRFFRAIRTVYKAFSLTNWVLTKSL